MSSHNPLRKDSSQVIDEETEALNGSRACPRSHMQGVAELGFAACQSSLQHIAPALSHGDPVGSEEDGPALGTPSPPVGLAPGCHSVSPLQGQILSEIRRKWRAVHAWHPHMTHSVGNKRGHALWVWSLTPGQILPGLDSHTNQRPSA